MCLSPNKPLLACLPDLAALLALSAVVRLARIAAPGLVRDAKSVFAGARRSVAPDSSHHSGQR